MKKPRGPVAPKWPDAMMWPLSRIKPYERNPRTHPQAQIDLLANLIKQYGPDQPIVVDEAGTILKGHGRLLAARAAGRADFPVVQRSGLSDADKTAMRLSDNQVALLSGWDKELIQGEIGALKLNGYDVGLLGFPDIQLCGWGILVGTDGARDPEAAPQSPKTPIVRRGDIWTLGDHRILCGDATDPKDVKRLMGGSKAVLMNTDPPYGINYGDIANSRSRPASVRQGGDGKDYSTHVDKEIENDDLDGAALQDFLERTIRTALPHLIEKPAFYLWHPMLTQGTFFAAAAAADILIHRQIIWVKPSLIMGRGHYHWRHELCFYGWVRGKRCAWYGAHAQDTVWQVGRENDKIHPTQKPTELFVRPIINHTKRGDLIYEPFSGSGSQIIAAEMTGRRAFAVELKPSYCQVTIERWQTFSGRLATLDGRTLEQVTAARQTGRAKGGVDEAGDSRKSIPGKNEGGDGGKHRIRPRLHARRASAGRKPDGVPPVVAGDS